MDSHQQEQKKVIAEIERDVARDTVSFSTISRVENYELDKRMCLTSVHFPGDNLKNVITQQLISPLRDLQPDQYYYPPESFHMTVKNVKVVSDPPTYTSEDITRVREVFDSVVPRHKKFKVYFYKLILFPNNLSLIATTDKELDDLILDLDKELKGVGIFDDKKFNNDKYFFSNMTLVRFYNPVTTDFKEKVDDLSKNLDINDYIVDSVSLVTCNAVMKMRTIIQNWELG